MRPERWKFRDCRPTVERQPRIADGDHRTLLSRRFEAIELEQARRGNL
jgi:hypothetical protein